MLTLATADTIAGVATSATTVTFTIFGMELNGTTETYKCLAQGQLGNSAATIYTAPASNISLVKSIYLVNTNATTVQSVQLFRGGTAAANAITPIIQIPSGASAVYEDGQGWQIVLPTVAGALLSAVLTADTASQTSTTEAIVSPVLTVPANYCTAGTTIDFQLGFSAAQGATANTTPGILFQLRWGGVAGTVIASVGTITPATLLAALGGHIHGSMTIRTIGASGTAKAIMRVIDPRGTRVAAGDMASKIGMSAAGSGVVIDTTASKDLVITCKTTVADASAITFGTSGYFVVERS